MRRWIAILVCAWAGPAAAEKPFVPIPESDKPLYHFDLKRWIYADDAARNADKAELQRDKAQLGAMKPTVVKSGRQLLAAIEMRMAMQTITDRLSAEGGLRVAVDTRDAATADEADALSADCDAASQFVVDAVKGLDDQQLKRLMAEEPKLARYRFLVEGWRRDRPHSLQSATESLLLQLDPDLDPFAGRFYNLMVGRAPGAKIRLGDRDLSVTRPDDLAELLRAPDRGLRRRAFESWMNGYKSQGDLYAFALFRKAKLANSIAAARKYGDADEAALFGSYIDPAALDAVLAAFRGHAALATRFAEAERRYQQWLLGLPEAEPWDLQARPASMAEPRFVIGDAAKAVMGATERFSPDYRAELASLLDPRNRRLDVVAGDHRKSGDFTWGPYGTTLFYMQGYVGYLADVVTLAHESAHAVHYRLMKAAGVPFCYGDGARYFTEGFAKTNELLILEQLAKTAKSPEERLFYLREQVSKLASIKFAAVYWAALATSFERELYQRVKSGRLKEPAEVHALWGELGRLWSPDFARHPDLQYTWSATHHFFDASRYYVNYLFAWVFALAIYERLQDDAAFSEHYLALMKAGFTDTPAALLAKHLSIDLSDRAQLDRMFSLIEAKVADFETQVKALPKRR